MGENPISREEYIDKVLSAYRRTPGTAGTIRRPDRLLAAQLHERGVPLMAVENALVLAAARRMIRPAGSPPLGTIRSLAYFLPVIEEVLSLSVSPGYFPASAPQDRTPGPNAVGPLRSSLHQSSYSAPHAPSARMIRNPPARLRRGRYRLDPRFCSQSRSQWGSLQPSTTGHILASAGACGSTLARMGRTTVSSAVWTPYSPHSRASLARCSRTPN